MNATLIYRRLAPNATPLISWRNTRMRMLAGTKIHLLELTIASFEYLSVFSSAASRTEWSRR